MYMNSGLSKIMPQTRLRFRPIMMLVCAVLILLGPGTGIARAECHLRVGWDDWPPYITLQDGYFEGLEYDLLTAIAEDAGCSLEMIQVPWARALILLGAGHLDLLYGASYSVERAAFAKYSLPYRRERFVLVTKGENGTETNSIALAEWITSKKGRGGVRSLGLFLGDYYGRTIEEILKSGQNTMSLIEVSGNVQMIAMLKTDRIDGYIVEDAVAKIQISDAPFPLRSHLIEEQPADPLHYMFSKRIPDDVVQRFNAAIKKYESNNGS